MKKILVLLLMLAMTFALASCDVQSSINKILGKEEPAGDTHTHNYELISTDATCVEAGSAFYACECGDSYTEQIEALGHDMQVKSSVPPTCTRLGYDRLSCSRCSLSKSEKIEATGHVWGEVVETSRMVLCTNEGCSAGYFEETDGKYSEVLVFKYTEEDKAALFAKFDAFEAELATLADYDPTQHAFAEEGELAEAFAAFDAKHTELYDGLIYAMEQRQIAEIAYFCDYSNQTIKARYDAMAEYYTGLVGRFYALSQPIYESLYREFFYQDMTEAEIKNYLEDSAAYSDPEYIALKNTSDSIESRYRDIANPDESSLVPELYAEFVANNNAIAEHFGYDNYLEYAYASVYDRDYTYDQIDNVIAYVREYIAPLFRIYASQYMNVNQTKTEYAGVFVNSFFNDTIGNATLNDYIDLITFNSNSDKVIRFSDEFNNLMGDGNMFRGTYDGAFVTYIYSHEIPIAYFGKGYDNAFTVAHEFGHYMNEIYNRSEYAQSYDLLEMHSQGNEMLYLASLKGQLSNVGYRDVKAGAIFNLLSTTLLSISVDMFERAVYTNTYTGTNADLIMTDGVIEASEYDLLYKGIFQDLGLADFYYPTYWRYVTITSPCYYISYAISALSVLQLYPMAMEDFDAAVDSYLKLITYTDVDAEMTTEQILNYAGLYSFFDEELYKYLYDAL